MLKQLAAKVLLVDDEKDFIELMSQRLATRGLKVVAVANGEDAVKTVTDQGFDVAVVDLSMPGIDGIETLKQIKALRDDIEVIMLTGQATVKTGIEAMQNGAMDFLEKPIVIDDLMKKIHDAKYKRMRALELKSETDMKNILKSKSW